MSLIDPAAFVGNTTVRIGDLTLIGHAVLNLATASRLMRHASPVGTTDYAEPWPTMPQRLVVDYTSWCGFQPGYEEARDRLLAFTRESGWEAQMLRGLGESA